MSGSAYVEASCGLGERQTLGSMMENANESQICSDPIPTNPHVDRCML